MTVADLWLPGALRFIAAGLIGAVLGSFLNVVIHRLPRKESIVFPPSRCPKCAARIAPWDNIPILSWLLLRGRCRSCRSPISIRYPLVELAAALLALLVVWRFGLEVSSIFYLWFCLALLAITLIDLEHRIIPDAITLPGILIGFLGIPWTRVTWLDSILGAVVGLGFLLLVAVVYERATGLEGMGGGDVKMAAMMGAFLGWPGVLLTIFLAAFLGSAVGLTLMARRKGGRRTALPFGTFLAPAAILVLFTGEALIHWYLGLILR